MTLSIIAAIGKNNELGKDNQLLWNLPEDMRHFRETTRGHTVIMGRKTFESIGRPLPNRKNIVVTRDRAYTAEGIEVAHSLEEALALVANDSSEVFVIGGATLYTEALPQADKLYITHVDGAFEADTFFPVIDASWKKTSETTIAKDAVHAYTMHFVTYEK